MEGRGGKEWREKGAVNKKGEALLWFLNLNVRQPCSRLKIFVTLKLLEILFKLLFLTIAFEMHLPEVHTII